MADLNQQETLSIIICRELGDNTGVTVEQVRQGVEEEQMPSCVISGIGNSMNLARLAAESSSLGIGVGIDKDGMITLTHHRMPFNQPVMQVSTRNDPGVARIIGTNAARLFKGRPFMDWPHIKTSFPEGFWEY
ncbi:hypothetical protein DCMF_27355 [Candidatus Formimonas warabiya]|uniref:Uncharacterized protein n=2 Tax=Formimonas warabiya TaxID=1761012 RepID=A0A3G1KZK6_FORW1|nr:hypothetical protein DCMF_27355 [Candidatus Formimonas warabiya]